jgi:hypothetical protein
MQTDDETSKIINQTIDAAEAIALRWVVALLNKFETQLVIKELESRLKELEDKI